MRCKCRRGAPERDVLALALLPELLEDTAAVRWSWRMAEPGIVRGEVWARPGRELEIATRAAEVLRRHGYAVAIAGPDWAPTLLVEHRPCAACRGIAA